MSHLVNRRGSNRAEGRGTGWRNPMNPANRKQPKVSIETRRKFIEMALSLDSVNVMEAGIARANLCEMNMAHL